jgi:predicted transcriptional regulator
MGKQYHPWLGMKKKEGGTTAKVEKFLATLYPDMKESDVDLLASLNDAKDVKKLAEELGWTKEQIKKELG